MNLINGIEVGQENSVNCEYLKLLECVGRAYLEYGLVKWWLKILKIISLSFIAKKLPGKTREEAQREKKQELEARLKDVTGHLISSKKPIKKGILKYYNPYDIVMHYRILFYFL